MNYNFLCNKMNVKEFLFSRIYISHRAFMAGVLFHYRKGSWRVV